MSRWSALTFSSFPNDIQLKGISLLKCCYYKQHRQKPELQVRYILKLSCISVTSGSYWCGAWSSNYYFKVVFFFFLKKKQHKRVSIVSRLNSLYGSSSVSCSKSSIVPHDTSHAKHSWHHRVDRKWLVLFFFLTNFQCFCWVLIGKAHFKFFFSRTISWIESLQQFCLVCGKCLVSI